LHIYAKDAKSATWVEEHVLTEHDAVITGIDWAPKSNRIVTCSHDRNAYVWSYNADNKTWKPILVLLRISHAAVAVKWSPLENKFAVASSAKCVAVCHFDVENDWWASKFIKKHKSTVLSLAWHPNNNLLLTGSSDMKARVFVACLKGVDAKPDFAPFTGKPAFGEMLAEYTMLGWVHSVVWSHSGNRFAFVGHDSTIGFVDVSKGSPGEVQILKIPFLPLQDLLFLTENSLVAGGHDCELVVFANSGGSWAFSNTIAQKKEATAQKTSGTQKAFELFKNKVEVGANTNVQTLSTLHQNCITCICPYKVIESSGDVKEFTTSALDGKLVLWQSP